MAGRDWLLAAVVALWNMPPLTDCAVEIPFSSNKYWFRPTQTVVQPWRGPHNVYGIFTIPEQYKRDRLYRAKLMIQGFTTEFTDTSPEGEDIYNGRAEPGHGIRDDITRPEPRAWRRGGEPLTAARRVGGTRGLRSTGQTSQDSARRRAPRRHHALHVGWAYRSWPCGCKRGLLPANDGRRADSQPALGAGAVGGDVSRSVTASRGGDTFVARPVA